MNCDILTIYVTTYRSIVESSLNINSTFNYPQVERQQYVCGLFSSVDPEASIVDIDITTMTDTVAGTVLIESTSGLFLSDPMARRYFCMTRSTRLASLSDEKRGAVGMEHVTI
jgi:hypothetical protein